MRYLRYDTLAGSYSTTVTPCSPCTVLFGFCVEVRSACKRREQLRERRIYFVSPQVRQPRRGNLLSLTSSSLPLYIFYIYIYKSIFYLFSLFIRAARLPSGDNALRERRSSSRCRATETFKVFAFAHGTYRHKQPSARGARTKHVFRSGDIVSSADARLIQRHILPLRIYTRA